MGVTVDPTRPGSNEADEDREVERVKSQVRFAAFKALRVVGTTLGLANLGAAAAQNYLAATVTTGLRAVAVTQLATILSGWLFNERTHRTGALVHVLFVALLGTTTLNTLGYTTGASAQLIWLCVTAGLFYGRRGAVVAIGVVTVVLAAFLGRIALGGMPSVGPYGSVFVPIDLSVRFSLAIVTVASILVGAVVAVVRGLEQATREMTRAVQRERAEREAHVRSLEKLARARRLQTIERLVSGVAHDLNNMLTPILSYGSLLLEPNPTPAEITEAATSIVSAATNAAKLTRQLQAFSPVGTQVRAPVDLHAELQETLALFRPTLDRRLKVEVLLTAPKATVLGDPALLRAAVINLLLNAQEAMASEGTLTVSTRAVGADQVEVAIADTGVGMSPEVQARLFEPYFTTKPDGTGLGLAAVYGTVHNHNGAIEVVSAPGKGTTVQLRFGLVKQPSAAPAPVAAAAIRPAQTRRALVVDDEPLVRRVLVRHLTRHGFECLEAGDGQAGLELYRARQGSIDLLVTDSEMPNVTGAELLAEVRKLSPSQPVLFVSGFIRGGNVEELSRDPCLRLLGKPFSEEQLMELVEPLVAPTADRT